MLFARKYKRDIIIFDEQLVRKNGQSLPMYSVLIKERKGKKRKKEKRKAVMKRNGVFDVHSTND